MTTLQSVAGLLDSFRSASGSPRLIWYGTGNERVELSGRVLENWVAKTSNLLVEELDATAGTVVALDLPAHWKTLVWALAAWQVGAGVRLGADGPADVRVAMDAPATGPTPAQEDELLVLVAPGALDLRWPGTLPAGAVDYAATVRSYGDVYLEAPADPASALLLDDGGAGTFSDLVGTPLPSADEGSAPAGGIWLVPAAVPMETLLAAAVQIWSGGGTVVLVDSGVEVTPRLLEGERVTARLAA